MAEPLSLKLLRRNHDGEDHKAIECLEDNLPRRVRYSERGYNGVLSHAQNLRQEDDC